MKFPNFFQKEAPRQAVEPRRSLSEDIEARREHGEDDEESRAFHRAVAFEAMERREALVKLRESLRRTLGVDVEPDGNPALVEGLWFLEEKMPAKAGAFWFLYFCYPCQNCGTLAKVFRLEAVSPYDEPLPGDSDPRKQEESLRQIAAFLDRVEDGRKRHLCPDCKLEEKPE